MKTMKMILAMLLSVCMLFSCAVSEEAETAENPNPVIARLREHEVYYQDVVSYAQQMYSEGLIASETDYASALDYLLIYNALPKVMVNDLGIENLLSQEKIEELYQQAEEIYNSEIESYIAYYYGSDLSEEDYQAVYEMVAGAYAEAGYPLETYKEDFVVGEAFAAHFNTFTFDISEDTLLSTFNEFVESDRAMFEGNVMMYEYAVNYYNYVSYYMPEGYRGITHILIDADADALSAYAAACEGTDAEAIEAAKAAVIESCQEKLDEIYGKIENGESFDSLIAEYNTDPGMSGDNLKNGYAVHKDTVVFMQEFTDGAFSEKMQAVGDVSDPVVTSYGVHILYYLRDIPGGVVEYTDEIKAAVYDYCKATEQDALLRQWLNDYGVEYTAEYAEVMG
ncbi:MAG: peptidylprolyl isomerase [Clostridia bacterium]|nr:peptidylprolyl isomerase [Clostridia bacterium]